MPPRSPLPPRHGLQSAWVRSPSSGPWPTLAAWLHERLSPGVDVDAFLATGRIVDLTGTPVCATDPFRPDADLYFHRDLRPEPVVPGGLPVLYRDERIVVVDKPHFLSSIPRGRHVVQSVVVRAREELGMADLGPAHRLDRETAGVLLLTTEKRWRAPYQQLFEQRRPRKVYEALAAHDPGLELPRVVRSHIVKDRGVLTAREVPGAAPNAETLVELVEVRGGIGRYRLTPTTGRTHQLRVHLAALGIPIVDDPLYPTPWPDDVDDFSRPLRLLARTLAFTDPVDGTERELTSRRTLDWPGEAQSSTTTSA